MLSIQPIEPPPAPSVSTWIIGMPIRYRSMSMFLLMLVTPLRVSVMSKDVPPISMVMTFFFLNGAVTNNPACGAEAGPELMA